MTSYEDSDLFAPGMAANLYTANDWAFQGNIAFEPVYEGNFEADIDAIAGSVGDDSGYISNDVDSFEANYEIRSSEGPSSPANFEVRTAGSVHQFYTDTVASNKSNRGSIHNGSLHKSTTQIEKGTRGKRPKETRMSKTLYHPVPEFEHKPAHQYSSFNGVAGDQHPREVWKRTYERHEWIAYRLEQPSNSLSTQRHKMAARSDA